MTACAAVAERNGEEETDPVKSPSGDHGVKKEGNESNVVKVLVQILGSADPETALLDAVSNGVIPDDVCLELAEHLGKLVKAMNFDNRIETVFALRESEAISEKTQEILLLAILEMDEQEEVPAEAETPIQAPTFESPTAAPPLEPSTEGQTGQAQAPTANLIIDLVRSVTELQRQFGTNLPEEKQSEIRQVVAKLPEEEFNSLRQTLGSAILAQAEIPAVERTVDVAASLQVVEILLGQRQAKLTSAVFLAYETLVSEGFRCLLTLRNGYDHPLMTVSSTALLRNRFRRWLDSRESGLSADELASAQKAVATLEGFLLAAADDYTKTAIQRDRAIRLRERVISSQIRVLDAVNEELVAALPRTKGDALQQVWGYLNAEQSKLAFELRTAGSAILGEAEATIRRIFDLHSACAALRREINELEVSNYDPLSQRPALTGTEKRLAFFESERPDLLLDYFELAEVLKSPELRGNERKKTVRQLGELADKLEELDQLIAGLRPTPELEVRHG